MYHLCILIILYKREREGERGKRKEGTRRYIGKLVACARARLKTCLFFFNEPRFDVFISLIFFHSSKYIIISLLHAFMKKSPIFPSTAESYIFCFVRHCLRVHTNHSEIKHIYNIFSVCCCVPFYVCLPSWLRYLCLLCCFVLSSFYRHLQLIGFSVS